MGRNKYGLPTPEPRDPPTARHKRHKHAYAEGGKIMGFFDRKQKTQAEQEAEIDARIAAREAAARAAEQSQPASNPHAADVFARDPNNIAGRIKARRDLARDVENDAVEGKKKGGIIKAKSKPRGVGCAVKGHGKGRMR
jgi:hypothetical protein